LHSPPFPTRRSSDLDLPTAPPRTNSPTVAGASLDGPEPVPPGMSSRCLSSCRALRREPPRLPHRNQLIAAGGSVPLGLCESVQLDRKSTRLNSSHVK